MLKCAAIQTEKPDLSSTHFYLKPGRGSVASSSTALSEVVIAGHFRFLFRLDRIIITTVSKDRKCFDYYSCVFHLFLLKHSFIVLFFEIN
jgi:hypothetical protein